MAIKPFKIPLSVLVVIHTRDLQVLLIERAYKTGFWQSVTGSKDAVDEPLVETCVREVQEETGIVIGAEQGAVSLTNLRDWQLENVYPIYPEWRHRYAPGVTHNTERVFDLQVPRDIRITLSPREHTRYEWLPYLAAADKCFSSSNAEAILLLPTFIQA